jgi:hypothetical protein
VDWFQDALGHVDWKRCMLFFVRHYLAIDPTYPPYTPANVCAITPLQATADLGSMHWNQVEAILDGVEAADSDLLVELGGSLSRMAIRWERYLARQIILAEKLNQFDADDRDAIAQCDQQFYRLMTKFAVNYEFLPVTIARLL